MALQIVAGSASYALLRELCVVRRVALLGSIFVELNGTFSWVGDPAYLPMAFLPLFLLGIERAWRRGHLPGGWTWISVSIAYSLYAGFPETAYIDGLLALAWIICRLTQVPTWQRRRAFAAKIVVGGFIGLLLAAPIIVPFVESLPLSYTGIHDMMDNPLFGIHLGNFAMFLFPFVFGPVEYLNWIDSGHGPIWLMWGTVGGHITLALLFLAVLGLVSRHRETALRVVLAAWIIVVLLKSGGFGPVSHLVDLIPFLGQARFYRYAVPSWEIATIILVAFTLDDWHRGFPSSLRQRMLASASPQPRVGQRFSSGGTSSTACSTRARSRPPISCAAGSTFPTSPTCWPASPRRSR